MGWIHIDTGKRAASENMALDEALLTDLEHETNSLLHLYDWEKDAATFGHFIDPSKFLNLEGIAKRGIDLSKRPTGGGIIFHHCDLAFSVLVPASHESFSLNPLDNYAFVNNRVIWAICQAFSFDFPIELLPEEPEPLDEHSRSFCMAKSTKYDVMVQGRKAGGAAQRKTRHGFLHQGSISLGLVPEEYLLEVLASETQVAERMKQNSFALLGENWSQKELEEARSSLRNFLQKAFSQEFKE